MRNRRWICLLLAVLMVLACTACGAKANDGASGDMRTLTDGKNRTVEVPKQVDRVVCIGVGALRYSCYVGAADRAVGVEDYETKAGMSRLYNYVNFDKFKDLPVTGTNGEPYVEQIIDVAPQVIVMSAYASCDADELSAKTGIPVFVVPGSDTTLDDAAYDTTGQAGAFNIDTEQVLAWDPDVIFLDFNGMSLINEDYQAHPDFYKSLSAVRDGKVYSQISFRSCASNLETALADAYYAACMLYPEQFADVDPEVKAGEIFTELLGSNPYPDLKEAGYAFRAITLGE